jgi:hypothetical protein
MDLLEPIRRTGLSPIGKSCCWQAAHHGSIPEMVPGVSPEFIPKYQRSRSKIRSDGCLYCTGTGLRQLAKNFIFVRADLQSTQHKHCHNVKGSPAVLNS